VLFLSSFENVQSAKSDPVHSQHIPIRDQNLLKIGVMGSPPPGPPFFSFPCYSSLSPPALVKSGSGGGKEGAGERRGAPPFCLYASLGRSMGRGGRRRPGGGPGRGRPPWPGPWRPAARLPTPPTPHRHRTRTVGCPPPLLAGPNYCLSRRGGLLAIKRERNHFARPTQKEQASPPPEGVTRGDGCGPPFCCLGPTRKENKANPG